MKKKLSKEKNKMLFLINPVAGKGLGKKYAFGLISLFTKEGFFVTARPTDPDAEKNIDFVCKNAADYDVVVCCGGDGTLSQTISGIVNSGAETPIGYIPLGTTNDFAKTLGIPSTPSEAALAIAKRKIKPIDCGIFNGKAFAYVSATGAFTQASYGATSAQKNLFGSLAYIFKGIESLSSIKSFHMKIKADEKFIEGDYLYASVSNSTSLGGLFRLDPSKVKTNDGVFELVLIKNPQNMSEKKKLVVGLLSESLNSEYVDLIYAQNIKIKLKEPQGWSLDGENGGKHKEIIIKNLNNRINMLGIK